MEHMHSPAHKQFLMSVFRDNKIKDQVLQQMVCLRTEPLSQRLDLGLHKETEDLDSD